MKPFQIASLAIGLLAVLLIGYRRSPDYVGTYGFVPRPETPKWWTAEDTDRSVSKGRQFCTLNPDGTYEIYCDPDLGETYHGKYSVSGNAFHFNPDKSPSVQWVMDYDPERRTLTQRWDRRPPVILPGIYEKQ